MLARTAVMLLAFSALARAAAPTGLLSAVSGKVEIVRAGEKTSQAARVADLVSDGDRVVTGRGGEATILFCPESRALKMPSETEVQFEANTLRVTKGKLTDERKLPSCRLPSTLALASASQLQSGTLRLRGGDLLLDSPSRTNIASQRPRFRWEPVDEATTYAIKVTDREERVLWTHTGGTTEAEYPADAGVLNWGQKYTWQVTALKGADELTYAKTYFQVLPQEKADSVRETEAGLRRALQENPSDSGPLFLLAFLYEDNGMLDAAARTYGELAKSSGPEGWVQGRMTEMMNKVGWTKLDSAAAK